MEHYVSSMSNIRRMEDTQPEYKLIDLQPLEMCIRDSIPVEGGAFLAWGHLTYPRPLTEKEASDYEPVSYTHLDVYTRQAIR